MKRILLCVLLFVLLLNYSDCSRISWFPNVIDTVSNRTSQITNYVRDKGRSIKHYYVENVHKKIGSYLGFHSHNKIATDFDYDNNIMNRQVRAKKVFNDYVLEAQANNNQIFDNIAPEETINKCTDDDPTVHLTTPQLIALHGFASESHTIVTDDGYILTVHRIPYSKNSTHKTAPRKTALLHHGLLGSSADWIIAGPKKSLAYILADAGYDVWLANVRGNTYSRAHISRHIDSFSFWNFTFHEVSQHDLPAVIDYIMEVKGWDVKINYIGHSMGTTILFGLLSTKTHYNKILRAGFALAPVAYMSDIESPIRLLAKFSNNIEFLLKLLGANEFLPQNAVMRWLSKHACEINHYEEVICENSLFILCGHDEKQFNRTLLPLILAHVPAGASTKTLIHYAQEIKKSGRFQQFDYGAEGNILEYGSLTPPEYPLHNITLPVALLSAQNDWLASEKDVKNLYAQLANPIEHYVVPLKEFNHIDFLWAVDAPSLVYAKLLKLMDGDVNNRFNEFDTDIETNMLDV